MSETKTKKSKEQIIEILTAVFLGITALATAWASWIGSLHGGNQSTNYTTSNNLSAEGNSMYNEASQSLMQDMILWNDITSVRIDYTFAQEKGDIDETDRLQWKLDKLMMQLNGLMSRKRMFRLLIKKDLLTAILLRRRIRYLRLMSFWNRVRKITPTEMHSDL